MGLQLLVAEEGGPVDALEHGAVLIAAPVRARHVQQLECAHLGGAVYMRATAQVREAALVVDAHLLVFNRFDDLLLVGLVCEQLQRLVLGDVPIRERPVAGDNGPHPLFQ